MGVVESELVWSLNLFVCRIKIMLLLLIYMGSYTLIQSLMGKALVHLPLYAPAVTCLTQPPLSASGRVLVSPFLSPSVWRAFDPSAQILLLYTRAHRVLSIMRQGKWYCETIVRVTCHWASPGRPWINVDATVVIIIIIMLHCHLTSGADFTPKITAFLVLLLNTAIWLPKQTLFSKTTAL